MRASHEHVEESACDLSSEHSTHQITVRWDPGEVGRFRAERRAHAHSSSISYPV